MARARTPVRVVRKNAGLALAASLVAAIPARIRRGLNIRERSCRRGEGVSGTADVYDAESVCALLAMLDVAPRSRVAVAPWSRCGGRRARVRTVRSTAWRAKAVGNCALRRSRAARAVNAVAVVAPCSSSVGVLVCCVKALAPRVAVVRGVALPVRAVRGGPTHLGGDRADEGKDGNGGKLHY